MQLISKCYNSRILNNYVKQQVKYFSINNKLYQQHYDIIIAGGGMVGFAAACAIGSSNRLKNKSILLLEAQNHKEWILPKEYVNRVTAVNNETMKFFKKMEVWNHITNMRATPFSKMQIWESCSEAFITFDSNNYENLVGHIVENDVIIAALKKQLPNNVKVSYGTKVANYKIPSSIDSKLEVTLQNKDVVSTDLLVGADGANSSVRNAIKSTYLSWNYDQMAIVATLSLSEDMDNNVAWQKFLPTGPLALLPLSSNRSSLVWSTRKENAKELLKLPHDSFISALNDALWSSDQVNSFVQNVYEKWEKFLELLPTDDRKLQYKQLPPSIGDVVPNSRGAFPLGLGHSVHYVAPRVALVGDAAHKVHPLAGQGVNLGFGDVLELVHQLETAVLNGSDIGNENNLHKYESIRQKHNLATMASIDGLYRLYTTTLTPLVLLRTLGLSAVDSCSPLKKRIMNHAGT